jgi:hypothetical protein
MKRLQQKKKPEPASTTVIVSRCVFWLLVLAVPAVTFGYYFYGGLAPLAIVGSFYQKSMKPKGISPFPSRIIHSWVGTWIYEMFCLPIADEPIKRKKIFGLTYYEGKPLETHLLIGAIIFCIGAIFLVSTLIWEWKGVYDIDDMKMIQGVFHDKYPTSKRDRCADYILTFRQDDGSLVNFYSYNRNKALLEALENGRKNDDIFTIWATPEDKPMPRCIKYLYIRQLKGKTYEMLYDKDDTKKRNKSAIKFFMITGIIVCCISGMFFYPVYAAGVKRKSQQKSSCRL